MSVKIIDATWGDLSRPEAVIMPQKPLLAGEGYQPEESLMIHLTVTGRCYAQCVGCINSAITLASDQPRSSLETFQETQPSRDGRIIKLLAQRQNLPSITICFYGGEPFLALDKMYEVWQYLKNNRENQKFRFLVYTNGELLREAIKKYPDFIQALWLISVSIDGRQQQHNRVRPGTNLTKIVNNLKALAPVYDGHVLFWSTLRESQSLLDCFKEFMELYCLKLVHHFFWHWAEQRQPFQDLPSYASQYAQELRQIMKNYRQEIARGKILPLTHINELILYLLTGRQRGHTACGVELAKNYDIVSGQVYPCADLPNEASIGQLNQQGKLELKETNLKALTAYKPRLGCYQCGVHNYCGGRCPVQALAGSWQRTLEYCQLMRLHVGVVQEYLNDIISSLRKNSISLQDIYNRSAFLAKYTDVVP